MHHMWLHANLETPFEKDNLVRRVAEATRLQALLREHPSLRPQKRGTQPIIGYRIDERQLYGWQLY